MNVVLACGACSDALIESNGWWFALTPFLFLGLLFEGAVFSLATWGMKLESVSPRAYPAAVAAGLLTLSALSRFGITAGVILAVMILLPTAAWSLFRNRRFSPALTGVRVAVIAMGLGVGLWQAWPAHRSLDDLVDVAITMTRFRAVDGWIFDELRRRPEAIAEVERIASTDTDETILKLHRTLGGSPAFRVAKCQDHPDFKEVCP